MVNFEELIKELGYHQSEFWVTDIESYPATAHLYRAAKIAGIRGVYLFRTSPADQEILPPKPLVYVAEVNTEDEARALHHKIWNLGSAPFLIIILPNHIRVYKGFCYEPDNSEANIFIEEENTTIGALRSTLAEFYAKEIDSGAIWESKKIKLDLNKRIDKHLLRNLQHLGEFLIHELGIKKTIAHSLIGKYIYLSYLRDRNILSDDWLQEKNIKIDNILGKNANKKELLKLVTALEDRFNGQIFPLPLSGADSPNDDAISYVASVFAGEDIATNQLALNFKIYDFSYIPVELLSSIYEQFLHVQGYGKEVGAYYTPEPLADYLLSELNSIKTLRKNTKVLDPCCGSGVFLVLIYRKFIETELAKRHNEKLSAVELRDILENNIYGVEQNTDACYVTEFSLILTLLSYIDPPDLHHNRRFKFPALHNTRIFQCDFFDSNSIFWKKNLKFDWIIGNPPWIKPAPRSYAKKWIDESSANRPVTGNRLCEAFSWRVTDLLSPEGYVGLVIHATILTNEKAIKYRKAFFKQNSVKRITNFSNLAYVLFDRRAEAPAVTIIYTKRQNGDIDNPIIHYGPFVANQLPIRSQRNKRNWTITIFENEIQSVAQRQAATGDGIVWKMALWGNHRDKRIVDRVIFPKTLSNLIQDRNWNLCQGLQLRDYRSGEPIEFEQSLKDSRALDPKSMSNSGNIFTVPVEALRQLPDGMCYIRKRGGREGLKTIKGPHLVLGSQFAAYSDLDFIIQHSQIGLSAPKIDSNYLRALSVYLNSSFARYYAFFRSSTWGIDRSILYPGEIEKIPVPEFSGEQIARLATLHHKMSKKENKLKRKNDFFESTEILHEYQLRNELDKEVSKTLRIPKTLCILARDFINIRLCFNKGRVKDDAIKVPSKKNLLAYSVLLRDELNEFSGANHKISIHISDHWICCEIEIVNDRSIVKPEIFDKMNKNSTFDSFWKMLKRKKSQWVYVQRGLRVFNGKRVYLCKSPRLVDWTSTQALLDSDDVISEILSSKEKARLDA